MPLNISETVLSFSAILEFQMREKAVDDSGQHEFTIPAFSPLKLPLPGSSLVMHLRIGM